MSHHKNPFNNKLWLTSLPISFLFLRFRVNFIIYVLKRSSLVKVKVFEINKSGLSPLSQEMEETIQKWLDESGEIKIVGTAQSQHLRENTVFVTIFYTDDKN